MTGRRRLALGGALSLLVAAAILAVALLEGDLTEEFSDLATLGQRAFATLGVPGALALLYIEESGVPLPIPGDAYVVFLGSLAAGSAWKLIAAWLAVIAVVVGGSSNLYLLSRRWGHRLLEHRLAGFLHLDHGRLDRVEGWLRRWGAIAIIFGRHVPGFRIPVTVLAGMFEVPYRVFAPSVAISTAIWAGVWLWLGQRYGRAALHLISGHPWLYVGAAVVVALVVGTLAVRTWLRAGRPPSSGPSGGSVRDKRLSREASPKRSLRA